MLPTPPDTHTCMLAVLLLRNSTNSEKEIWWSPAVWRETMCCVLRVCVCVCVLGGRGARVEEAMGVRADLSPAEQGEQRPGAGEARHACTCRWGPRTTAWARLPSGSECRARTTARAACRQCSARLTIGVGLLHHNLHFRLRHAIPPQQRPQLACGGRGTATQQPLRRQPVRHTCRGGACAYNAAGCTKAPQGRHTPFGQHSKQGSPCSPLHGNNGNWQAARQTSHPLALT